MGKVGVAKDKGAIRGKAKASARTRDRVKPNHPAKVNPDRPDRANRMRPGKPDHNPHPEQVDNRAPANLGNLALLEMSLAMSNSPYPAACHHRCIAQVGAANN